jgi:hypothetical protein
MSTNSPRFAANILKAALRLHDQRTDPTALGDDGMRYSSALLSSYQNQAIRDLIKDTYASIGDKIDGLMPEIVSEVNGVVLTNGNGPLPSNVWLVLEAGADDYSWYGWKIQSNPLKVKTSRDALVTPTLLKPAWYQKGRYIQFLPTTRTGPVSVWAIENPADISLASTTDFNYVDIITGATLNGNFESLLGGAGFTSWQSVEGIWTHIGWANADAHSGNQGCFFDGAWSGQVGVYQNVLTVGNYYHVEFYAKGEVGSTMQVLSGGTVVGEAVMAANYQKYTIEFTAIAAPFVIQRKASDGSKNQWLDDVYLKGSTVSVGSGDITLAPIWDGEIVNRMVALGVADAKSSIAIG